MLLLLLLLWDGDGLFLCVGLEGVNKPREVRFFPPFRDEEPSLPEGTASPKSML